MCSDDLKWNICSGLDKRNTLVIGQASDSMREFKQKDEPDSTPRWQVTHKEWEHLFYS